MDEDEKKVFRFRADAKMDADSIDEAFALLAAHFAALAAGWTPSESIFHEGGVSLAVEPCPN